MIDKRILTLMTAVICFVCALVPLPMRANVQSDVPQNQVTQQIMRDDDVPMQPLKLLRGESRSVEEDFSNIQVLITTGAVSSISLKLYGAYYIKENMRSVVGSMDAPLTLTITANGTTVRASSGSSNLYSGSKLTLMRVNLNSSAGYAQLVTSGNSSNNGRKYLGNFILSSNSNGSVRVINDVPTAHYLYGIVPYEMSEIWDIEALKSQAIASKSYAFGFTYPGDDYDITDSFNYQGYRGYEAGHDKCMRACIEDVCGRILSINDEIILTFYGGTNGGETQLPSYAFGSSGIDYAYEIKLDDLDFEYASSKRQTLEIVYGQAPTNSAFARLLTDEAVKIVGSGASVLRVTNANLHTPQFNGTQRNMTRMSVSMDVADASGNASNITVDFSVTKLKSYGIFNASYRMYWGERTSRGYKVYFCRWGHGLGLSQWGAQARARNGATFDEILGFYFNKFDLSHITERNPEEPYSYTQEVLAYGVITGTSVNIRTGPGTNYASLGQLSRNTHLDIVGERDGWIICIANGMLGYVRGDYVGVVLFPAPNDAEAMIGEARTTKSAGLYSSPSEYSSRLATLNANTSIYVWNTIGGWYYVETENGYGFVKSSSVSVSNWLTIDLDKLISSIADGILMPRP